MHTQPTCNRRLAGVAIVRPDLWLTSLCRAKLFCVASARRRDDGMLQLHLGHVIVEVEGEEEKTKRKLHCWVRSLENLLDCVS